MKAKKINEEILDFKRSQNSKKSLDVGYTDYLGYVKRELEKHGLDDIKFWETYYDWSQDNDKSDMIENTLDVLKNTPLEYQIDFIQDDLDEYIKDLNN